MPKPSKRMAARQSELSKRKKRDRPAIEGTGAVVEEPSGEPVEAAAETISALPVPQTVLPASPQPQRPASGPFRQPSFRSSSRGATPPREGQQMVGRPLPKSMYQGRDLRAITIVTGLLLAVLISLKFVL